MNDIESIVHNKNNPVWLGQPSRGMRGYDRFLVRWSQVLNWGVRYEACESFYGFMDDFGSWVPVEGLLILTYV
jgi:hypothetical protein